ncbi:MAG: hypothetical protein AB7N80_10800 [Bdellovibrionales bacterium]
MLNQQTFHNAIAKVNKDGFSTINLKKIFPANLGRDLFDAMDRVDFHSSRADYYNEVCLHWPEDWKDVPNGLAAFHDSDHLAQILSNEDAKKLLQENLGAKLTRSIFNFTEKIKNLIMRTHHGLPNNELRLSRLMIRQMGPTQTTTHGTADLHEDLGYEHRPYQQLLSAVLTTYGAPTIAPRHPCQIGELLIFNAFDRRRILGLPETQAFVHKGPKSGPKLLFFFEFLGPQDLL